jgi:catechol 2,3-dioxygenase-like lactoylglutathione lyase family enzyme
MSRISGLRGLRHAAIHVSDVARSSAFYQQVLGMAVVWEPDPQNVYLSSGCDNLALHGSLENSGSTGAGRLDHLGFIVDTVERVKQLEREFRALGVVILQPFKIHRDGSASFYCADPDGIVIQMLYEPSLSAQRIE